FQGPNVREAGGELFSGSLRPAAVAPQGDDAVAGLEELGAHGDEVLKVLHEAAKEVAEYVVEANVDTAVGKAFDHFPTDVRRQRLPDNVGVAARFVEPTDQSDLSGILPADLSMLRAAFLLVKHLANFPGTLVRGAQDIHVQLPEALGDRNRLYFRTDVDDRVAADDFLRLGEGAVGHEHFPSRHPDFRAQRAGPKTACAHERSGLRHILIKAGDGSQQPRIRRLP